MSPAKTTRPNASMLEWHGVQPMTNFTAAGAAIVLCKQFSPAVIDSWLQEFGYTFESAGNANRLAIAVAERGPRITRELVAHRDRLAANATMSAGRITGRASVIAP